MSGFELEASLLDGERAREGRERALDTLADLVAKAELTDREREVLVLRLCGFTFLKVAAIVGFHYSRGGALEQAAIKKLKWAA